MLVVLRRIDDGYMRVLACIERHVRALQQLFGIVAVARGDSDADARLELQFEPVDDERLLERAADSLGDEECTRTVGSAEQEERELISAEPCNGVARTRDGLQPFGKVCKDR